MGEAVVNAKGARRLGAGHMWVYADDVLLRPGTQAQVVRVRDPRQRLLGQALFSPDSRIALRFFAPGTQDLLSAAQQQALVQQRVRAALQRRARSLTHFAQRDAYRMLHGEADGLPGLFADRYGPCVVLQSSCAAADLWLVWAAQALQEAFDPGLIVVRNDGRARAHEKLSAAVQVLHGDAEAAAQTIYHEGNIALQIDVLHDQKTGGFLDQVDNHLRVGTLSHGRGLDLCTYHGGFALQMAQRCNHTTAYDSSAAALQRAQHNADRNGLQKISFAQGDVFAVLPALRQAQERFDTIVLDPPALASTQPTVQRAWQAYRLLNRHAMRLLAPGGVLVTCSCSGRITREDFAAMLLATAHEVGVRLHVLERRGAGADHPVLLGMPETDYLKAWVLQRA